MADFKFADEDVPVPEQPAGKPAPTATPATATPPAPPAPVATTAVPSPPLPMVPGVVTTAAPQGTAPPVPQVAAPTAPPVPTPPAPTVPLPATARPAGPAAPHAAARPTAPTPPAPAGPAPSVPTPPSPRLAPQGGPAAPMAKTAPAAAPPRPHVPTPGAAFPQPQLAARPLDQSQSGELARNIMATHGREHVDTKDPLWQKALDAMDPYAAWVFRTAGIASGLMLVYTLLMIFGGGIGNYDPHAPSAAQILRNVGFATKVLNVGLILMAISLITMAFDESMVGIGIIALGLFFHFGVPLLTYSQLGRSNVTVVMAETYRHFGFYLTIIGLCKYALDMWRWLVTLPDRVKSRADVGFAAQAEPAQQREAQSATMFSPCWKLPYCREVIRKQCPAYLARKRCWKFGRGCYCDEEMISRIIRGESLDVIKAPTRQSRQGKPPCGRCYIYLEHQTLKFRAMSWLAIPGTIGAMFAIWPAYTKAFQVASHSMDKLWAGLSSVDPTKFTPGMLKTTEVTSSQLSSQQVADFAQLLFGVILGFVLLIYLSKAIEWAIFKAKL